MQIRVEDDVHNDMGRLVHMKILSFYLSSKLYRVLDRKRFNAARRQLNHRLFKSTASTRSFYLLQMAGRNDDHELYVKLYSVVSSCNPLCWFLFYIRSVGVTLSNWDLPPPEIMYFHRSLFSGTIFIINGLCSSVPTLSFPSLLSLLIPKQN